MSLVLITSDGKEKNMFAELRRSKLFTSNNGFYKFLRTVVQAAVGYIVNNLAMIVAATNFDASVQALIVSGCMIILAPLMSALGMDDEKARNKNAQ